MNTIYDTLTKAQLITFIDRMDDPIFIIKTSHLFEPLQIIFANDAAVRNSEYPRADLLQMAPLDLLDPSDRKAYTEQLLQLDEQPKITIDSILLTKNGAKLPVEVSCSLLDFQEEDDSIYVITIVRHVSDRKANHILLERATREFESLYRFNPDLIFSTDSSGQFTNINPACENILGYSRNELFTLSYQKIIPEQNIPIFLEKFNSVLEGQSVTFTISIRSKEQKRIDLNITAVPIVVNQQVEGMIAIGRDITAQNITENLLIESEQRYKSMFQYNIDAVATISLDGNLFYTNPATEALLGFSRSELLGQPFIDFIVPDYRKDVQNQLDQTMKGKPLQHETVMFNCHQEHRHVHLTLIPTIVNKVMTGIHLIAKDITEKKQNEDKIRFLAFHDALTRLPNQFKFQQDLNTLLADSRIRQLQFSVLTIDMDRFKFINDYLGFEMGNMLLRKVSERLKDLIPPEGELYRYGGDELVVILRNSPPDTAELFGKTLTQSLSQPFKIKGFDTIVTVSIGISHFPLHGTEFNALIKASNSAMYYAKKIGRNNVQTFNKKIHSISTKHLKLESLLYKALENHEFTLHYQPQIDTDKDIMSGVEALIRWQNDELGMISPVDFIPLAEETGLILPIGEWVIHTACIQNTAWQAEGLPPMVMSVNLSIRQLFQPDLVKRVSAILQETRMDPKLLQLEITESVAMHADSAIGILHDLKLLGVRIAIDDFGTGFSSLNHLKKFPLDHLKIDRSFVHDIQNNTNDQDIVRTIIMLAHNLNLRVVAEGVENKHQETFLKELKCDLLQGFYFSKPVTSEMIPELIRQQSEINSDPHEM